MFYTTPNFALSPGTDFAEMGADPGTQVWRAVKLTIPKFILIVEYKGGERSQLVQTVLCSDVQPVIALLTDEGIKEARPYLWIPAAASAKGTIEVVPLGSILRGNYKPGLFKAQQEAHVFVTTCGQRFVDVFGLKETDIRDTLPLYVQTK
jgi:hypothetical protein